MLTIAQSLKKGGFIKHDGNICKIMEHDYQMGGGRAGGFVHIKVKDLSTGHAHEVKLAPHDKVEELEVTRHKMKYLYEDSSGLCFMDPENFEQVSLNKESLGHLTAYLKEETTVEVEFYNDNPIHVNLPEKVTLSVASTGAVKKGDGDSVYKPATLENGVEILVPQFIKEGDRIEVDVESGKYLDRV